MAMTYDYSTRHITRDFVLVEEREICRESGLPARAGNGRCHKCNYFGGKLYSWEYGSIIDDDATYVICKCKAKKDSAGCRKALSYLYEELEKRALCALDG
jgi:hypothetical protein